MQKKQILKIGLSILFVGATLTTAAYIMRYNICPKIKILAYDKEKGSIKIKWGNKEYTIDKTGFATNNKWIAVLDDDKLNVRNSNNKLIKSYDINVLTCNE